MKVTQHQLIELLMKHRNGANVISIHVVVPVLLKKSCKDATGKRRKNPFSEVHKEEWVTGMIQFNYKKKVLKQQERIGLVPRYVPRTSWHHVVKKDDNHLSPFSMHKERGEVEYLRVIKSQMYGTNYFDIDGHDVSYSEIEPFIPVEKEQLVPFRVYLLDHLIDIKIDGVIYTLRQQAK